MTVGEQEAPAGDAVRMDRAANLFERLAVREPDVAPLLARSYIGMRAYAFSGFDSCHMLTGVQTRK